VSEVGNAEAGKGVRSVESRKNVLEHVICHELSPNLYEHLKYLG